MPDTSGLRNVIDSAAEAAAAGDYVSAERLLLEVARQQEDSQGPLSPGLASTLNNLGIVSEFTGKPLDAERYFRRAWEIAAAVLPLDHPLVATSRRNFEDFCAARGQAIVAPVPPAVAAVADTREKRPLDRLPEPSRIASPPVVSRRRSPVAIGAVIAGDLLVAVIATTMWFRSAERVEPSQEDSAASPPERPAAAALPLPNDPAPTEVPSSVTANTNTVAPSSAPPTAGSRGAAAASELRAPAVTSARLCRDLSTTGQTGDSDWPCVPPSDPVSSGPLFFYSRLRSPTDVTIQHRWYRGDRLHHVVELPVRANTTRGYRTYSRNTFGNQDTGDWRVELTTNGGVVLHEERFVVR